MLHIPPNESNRLGRSARGVREICSAGRIRNVTLHRGSDDFELGRWIEMLKQALAKEIVLPRKPPIWQRGFFDHVLRSDESYAQKWNYVRQNPVRAGLVANADDWPYSGEIALIDRS